ncbi:MAG: PGF-CTERM sorting domain-containing protein [Methanosarcinaceae archaeon]
MNHKIIILFLLATVMLNGADYALATSITDPAGDFYFPDISGVTATVDGGNLNIVIACVENIQDNDIAGAVFIDTDQDYSTGYIHSPGYDYVYQFFVMPIIYSDPIKSVTLNDNIINTDTLNIAGNRIIITIPLSILGNDNGDLDIVVTTHTQIVKALDFDRAPDFGVLNLNDGSVKVPYPTNSDAGGSIIDRLGDSSSSDIVDLDTNVENGFLNIVITYNKNIEPADLSYVDDLNGWIFIDADQNLATGFTNTEQAPPTFGIDYRIEYTIGRILGTDASITKIDHGSDLAKTGYPQTTGVPIGVPYNDATFKVVQNKVFLGIPLGLLGHDEGNMDIVADSFTVQNILNDYESVPDNGQGALDTSKGSIKPLLSCTDSNVIITDPAGDSTGFGVDGDDITGIEACYAGDTLLVTITYSSLSLDDGAVTTIALDTDQNPDNIPEYVFIYSFYNGKLGASIFGESEGTYTAKSTDHLITMSGNKMYISIPIEFLGNDDRSMNLYVETAFVGNKAKIPSVQRSFYGEVYIHPDKSSRTIYDRAPDTGFISIGSTKNNIANNPENNDPVAKKEPGFESITAISGLLIAVYLLRRLG